MEGGAFPERRVKPTLAQVREALLNYYRPLRTNGSKVKAAIDHAKDSQLKKPGAATNSNRAMGNASNATRQANNST